MNTAQMFWVWVQIISRHGFRVEEFGSIWIHSDGQKGVCDWVIDGPGDGSSFSDLALEYTTLVLNVPIKAVD